jgi:hypothetical protein
MVWFQEHSSVRVITAGATALVAAVVVAGCGSATDRISERLSEEVLERVSGEDVDISRDGERIVISGQDGEFVIDANEETVTVESDEGSMQFSFGGDIPAEWSETVAVYPGAEVVSVFDFSSPEGVNQSVAMSVSDSPDDVLEFYDRALLAQGFTEVSRLSMGSGDDQLVQVAYEAGGLTASVMVGQSSEGVEVTVSLLG